MIYFDKNFIFLFFYFLYVFKFVDITVPPVVVKNDEWTWEEVCHYLYEEKAFDNIVISPGPGSPTCAADIGILRIQFHPFSFNHICLW